MICNCGISCFADVGCVLPLNSLSVDRFDPVCHQGFIHGALHINNFKRDVQRVESLKYTPPKREIICALYGYRGL